MSFREGNGTLQSPPGQEALIGKNPHESWFTWDCISLKIRRREKWWEKIKKIKPSYNQDPICYRPACYKSRAQKRAFSLGAAIYGAVGTGT